MTANQRRPGFRLPWSSEEEQGRAAPASDAPAAADPQPADATASTDEPVTPDAAAGAAPAVETAEATPVSGEPADQDAAADGAQAAPLAAEAEASPDFLRELVTAMRRVADEARQHGITDIRTAADDHVKRLEADAETRRGELRARADADIAGIGEWAKAEAERIKAEAEQRVLARRTQLEQQLGAETSRAEAEAKALRDRVGEYERELEAYHAQLAEINDPAAFAAAAKRMPKAPALEPRDPAARTSGMRAGTARAADAATDAPPAREPAATAETNGVAPAVPEVHPAEEEVLASRLAELDASLPEAPAASPSAAASATEPGTTDIVVSGLGSFGAITGFRQSLAAVDGIDGVALSLGQSGEFIFRASHRAGFDMTAAIVALEGDAAKVEPRPDGSLHVSLDRAR